MAVAIELVKEGRAAVVVSCGNTGTLMASGTIRSELWKGLSDRLWQRLCLVRKGTSF